jgi:UDP-4-amino-4,6-dideoxy-N-acetyl-beta-L-altrosamine N-acetyltransferase
MHPESSALSDLVVLRDLLLEDKEMIRTWRNKPRVAKYMFSQHEIGAEEHARWFVGLAEDPKRRYWIILYAGRPVGVANLAHIDYESRRCEFGIYLGEDDVRRKGVGSWAQYLVIEHVFNSMDVEQLWCDVLSDNEDALRMYRNIGLRQVGDRQQLAAANGETFEIYRLAIKRNEWKQVRESVAERLRKIGVR